MIYNVKTRRVSLHEQH